MNKSRNSAPALTNFAMRTKDSTTSGENNSNSLSNSAIELKDNTEDLPIQTDRVAPINQDGLPETGHERTEQDSSIGTAKTSLESSPPGDALLVGNSGGSFKEPSHQGQFRPPGIGGSSNSGMNGWSEKQQQSGMNGGPGKQAPFGPPGNGPWKPGMNGAPGKQGQVGPSGKGPWKPGMNGPGKPGQGGPPGGGFPGKPGMNGGPRPGGPFAMFRSGGPPMVGTFELFKFAKPKDRVLMVLGTLGAMLAGSCFIGNVTILGEVINLFVGNKTVGEETNYQDDLLPYIFAYIIVGSLSIIAGFTSISCWTLTAQRQVSTMRKRFFNSVMSQDIGWFDLHDSGEISSRFSEDMSKIQSGMGDKMAIFLQWSMTWLASLVVAFTRSWKLTLFALPFSPVMMMCGMLFFRTMRKMAMKEAMAYAKAGAIAEQAFRSIRTVQAFQGQEKECTRYNNNLGAAMKIASKKGLVLGLASSTFWIVIYTLFACVMWFGLWLVQNNGLEPGNIIPVFFGILIGSMSMSQAFTNLENLSIARGAAVKVFEVIGLSSPIDAFSPDGLRPDRITGRIEFQNVSFSYPARSDVTVSKDMSFIIEPGKHIALVGPSGCGKSTAIQLVQRFYDPSGGKVLLDGQDVKSLNVRWLREQIGVVSQEPVLFDTSIEENIRLGKIDASQEQIEAAAKMANAHNFIKLLPKGYQTNVGERGAQLSGGQKQRISIARALVSNPRILLMDEATSALDHESEAVVQAALEKAGRGRTTITIAHRLSTVKHADKIFAIHAGQIAEEGTHEELMEKEGLYFQLVKIQDKIDQDSSLDVSDVVIVDDNDAEDYTAEDKLLGTSFKRQLSRGNEGEGDGEAVNLSVRRSFRGKKKKGFGKKKAAAEGDNSEDAKTGQDESEQASLMEIIRYNKPEWPYILVSCITAMITGTIQPCFSFILSEFIRVFTVQDGSEQRDRVNILAASILGATVLVASARVLQEFCVNKSGAYLTARLRRLTFASIVNQVKMLATKDMEYFDSPNNQVGAITSRLAGDASLVQGATGSKVGQVLEGASTLICSLTIAFVFGWRLALVVVSFLPLMIAAGIIQGKVLRGAALKEKSSLQQAARICSESVDNIRTVASLHREDFFVKKFDVLIDQNDKSSWKRCAVFGIAYSIANSMLFFAYAASFAYGGKLIDDGKMEFYTVMRVFGAIIFGGMVIGRQSSFGIDYVKAKMAAGRIISLIKRKPKIDVRETTGEELDTIEGEVSIQGAKFHYVSRPNVKVLDGFDLPIKSGQTVALVGASGCGKSTTAQLMQRFYDLNNGAVMLDGHDIRKLNLSWYRRQIGVVSQEPMLFDCSIAENIAYGDNSREVPMADIIEAAKGANIHNFITSLPQGYDTNVGEKGTQLSGGQKQRVAIARALVRNPKILILDEATSALDTESESIVQEALDKASQDRTCITIAHRLSTIQKADKIAVVGNGKVIESGTHKELMAIKGAYYRLQNVQGKPASPNKAAVETVKL